MLVQKGAFNSALSWVTKGEAANLNSKQLRTLKAVNYIVLVAYLIGETILITSLAIRAK